MASLTGQLVAETYKALLKTIDNDILTASEKQITDGLGGGSNVFIDSQGFLRANKYKVTNGLATQFLKADGSLDANTYLTGITSSQIITALGYTPVPTTRTLTINGTTYDLSANRSWTIAGTSAVWGNITGTLSNQTDLQTALNAKYNNPTGTISQYIRGDGSLATFPTLPGGLPTGGTVGQILAKIDATDYNTHWIDNFATQTKNEVKLGATLAKGTAVYVSGSTGGSGTNMIVMAASNASEALSSKTFGLLETGGATNDLVKCVTFGLLAGLDTSTAQAGDPVWLGVNGALLFGLANKPVAPANMVYIGVVTRVQSNNGEIFVNVQNGFEIEELHDVLIQSKANNQGLFYESSTGLWKNKSIATVLGYTPQAQLDGTGFVKASGTTISYDNSTYLTTSDAASTYQRLDRMAINLLASDIQYPNNNAVIAALALKANAANPVFTGNMTISGAEPKLFFTDTDNNPDYTVFIDSGVFFIYDQTAGATRFSISSTGNISSGVGKSITAGSFVKESGTATQFLKADGSIDSSTYVTSTALADYLLITTAASTYQRLDRIASSLFASATNYPNNNAVIAGLALKADAANPVFTGSMNIQGLESRINFYDENNLRKFFIGYSSGQLSIFQDAGSATRFVINSSGNISTGVNNTITSWGFIKSGGTSSQFLKADGSIDSNSYALASSLGNYLPLAGGTMANTNLVTNLNADLLDGFHATKFAVGSAAEINSNAEINDNSRLNGMYRVNPGVTSAPYDSYWSLIEYGNVNNVVGQLASHFANGETYIRAYNTSWSAWRKLWDSVNLSNPISGSLTSGYIPKATGSGSLGNSLIYDNGTKVFIGTTTTNTISTGGLTLSNPTSSSLVLYNGGIVGFIYGSSIAAGMAVSSDYDLRFETGDGSGSNWPERMRLFRSTGNLSIGYGGAPADSGYKLDVNGTGRFIGTLQSDNGTTAELRLRGGGYASNYNTSLRSLAGAIGVLQFGNNDANYVLIGNTATGGYLDFRSNVSGESVSSGNFAMRINANGNIGINSTNSSEKLYVNGKILGVGKLFIQRESAGADTLIQFKNEVGSDRAYINFGGTNEELGFYSGAGGTRNMIIGSDGAMGFNYPTLAVRSFMFRAISGRPLAIEIAESGGVQSVYIRPNSSGRHLITSNYLSGGVYLPLALSGRENDGDLVLATSGNVLIGTATDNGAKLRVAGGTIDFAGDTRYGVARVYNASVGDMFGMEQVGSTQTGSGAATRLFVAPGGTNYLSLGWYTNATAFTDALRISAASGTALFNSIDTSGNRTSQFTAMTISADNNSNPYNGFGTALLFKNRIYSGGPSPGGIQDGARIRTSINTNSVENLGTDLIFDVSTTGNGSLTQILRLSYNGGASFSSNVTGTAFFESSDFRLKTLIEHNPIFEGIEKLQSKLYEKNGKIEIGYFAQDAQRYIPYAVTIGTDGFLSLSYREVHTAKIARLEQRVAELEKQLNLN